MYNANPTYINGFSQPLSLTKHRCTVNEKIKGARQTLCKNTLNGNPAFKWNVSNADKTFFCLKGLKQDVMMSKIWNFLK